MTTTPPHHRRPRVEGVRSRTITWTDPARVRFRLRGLDGYERLAAIKRGDASPPPAVALLGLSLDELERGRTVFSIVADELHENPMGTMHGGIVATLVDTAMGCAVVVDASRRRGLHDARAEHELRPRDHAVDRTRATPKVASCTAADASSPPKRASTTTREPSTRTPSRRASSSGATR